MPQVEVLSSTRGFPSLLKETVLIHAGKDVRPAFTPLPVSQDYPIVSTQESVLCPLLLRDSQLIKVSPLFLTQ